MKKELAVIGYGRFGRFAAALLRRDFRVSVSDPRRTIGLAPGLRRLSLGQAAEKPIVLLAVPINRLRQVLASMAPHLKPGTLVLDVCSVKEEPVRWMESLLPGHVSILGTHPLFGPDSASDGLSGHTIALCPVRIPESELRKVTGYLRNCGLRVQRFTPAGHDKMMASTLFLTQFVGHGLRRLPLAAPEHSTRNFQLLHQVASTTGNDSRELFRDMFRYNRFARRIPGKLLRSFEDLRKGLGPARP